MSNACTHALSTFLQTMENVSMDGPAGDRGKPVAIQNCHAPQLSHIRTTTQTGTPTQKKYTFKKARQLTFNRHNIVSPQLCVSWPGPLWSNCIFEVEYKDSNTLPDRHYRL